MSQILVVSTDGDGLNAMLNVLGSAGYCARATSGHAAALPAQPVLRTPERNWRTVRRTS